LADGSYQFRAVVTDPSHAHDDIPPSHVTGVQTCALPITLAFVGLDDTGSSDTPAITKDGTFSLSLSGDTDTNGVSVAYQVSTNEIGRASCREGVQTSVADGSYKLRAVVTDPAGNHSETPP